MIPKCCNCKECHKCPTGPTGATGSSGQCQCSCISKGQLITNGGMEDAEEEKLIGWVFVSEDGITSNNAQGRVHSGEYSVNIEDGSSISQNILLDEGGCYYLLSFFARGEGSQVGLNATVTFETTTGSVNGGEITVRQQDITNSNRSFAYYQLVTSKAPNNTTSITITFSVEANGGQSLDLDDVSLIVI